MSYTLTRRWLDGWRITSNSHSFSRPPVNAPIVALGHSYLDTRTQEGHRNDGPAESERLHTRLVIGVGS